jgi:hypothetical protein
MGYTPETGPFIAREDELDDILLAATPDIMVPAAVLELAPKKADRYGASVDEILVEYTRLEVQFREESGEVLHEV